MGKTKEKELLNTLFQQGKSCSQIMMEMSMNKLGMEDENLVKAMQGLAGGMGVRHACGVISGIACGMSLADEKIGPEKMFPEMYQWFYENYGDEHGGINCIELLDGDYDSRKMVCPDMIAKSWEKASEILEKYGFGSGNE